MEAPQGKPYSVAYQPSPWQVEFHQLQTHEACAAGAAGVGKTVSLVRDVVQRIRIEQARCEQRPIPGWSSELNDLIDRNPIKWGQSSGWALHLRREFRMIAQTLAKAGQFFKQVDPKVKWNGKFNYYIFPSGYRVQFDHCHLTSNVQQFLSSDYDHIGFDQLEQFDEDMYDNIITRKRSTDPVLKYMLKVRAMANPTVATQELTVKLKDPFWVRRRFVEPAPQGRVMFRRLLPPNKDGERKESTWIFLPGTLYDNPDKEFVQQYEATLLSAPWHIREALLHGNWYVVPGAYFSEYYQPRFHAHRPFQPDRYGRFVRAMDWGFVAWGCVLWGWLSEDNVLWVIREYDFRGMSPSAVAKAILGIEKNMGLSDGTRSRIVGVADTQLWENREGGVSKASVMSTHGVSWRPAFKGPGSRENNGRLVMERLKGAGPGRPGLVIFDTCQKLLGLLPGVQQDKDNKEEPAAFEGDDPIDTLFYLVAFCSKGKAAIPRVELMREHRPYRPVESRAHQESSTYGTSYGPGEGRGFR